MKRIFFRKAQHVGLTVNFGGNDFAFLLEYMNNPDVTKFLERRFPLYPAEERKWLETMHEHSNSNQVFGIALIKTGELVGTMGLHRINWISGTATTGAWIAEKANRGRGFGSEAKMLLLDYAFHTLMLRKISSTVLAMNGRSVRYNEKCGYKVEGVLKKQTAVYNDYVDEIRMAVFREDFEPLWKKYKESQK